MEAMTFIIDGNNVVFNNTKQPRLQQLLVLMKELKKFGKVISIVSHELRFRIDDKRGLDSYIQKRKIYQTPKGVDADSFILETSKQLNGIIISNDHFKQYKNEYTREISRRQPFMIVRLKDGRNQPIIPWLGRLPLMGEQHNE